MHQLEVSDVADASLLRFAHHHHLLLLRHHHRKLPLYHHHRHHHNCPLQSSIPCSSRVWCHCSFHLELRSGGVVPQGAEPRGKNISQHITPHIAALGVTPTTILTHSTPTDSSFSRHLSLSSVLLATLSVSTAARTIVSPGVRITYFHALSPSNVLHSLVCQATLCPPSTPPPPLHHTSCPAPSSRSPLLESRRNRLKSSSPAHHAPSPCPSQRVAVAASRSRSCAKRR